MAIEIRDQFKIGNRHYLLLSEWDRLYELSPDYGNNDYTEPGNIEASDEEVESVIGILPAPAPDDSVANTDEVEDPTIIIDKGEPDQWTEPSQGSVGVALCNGVTIRIYNQQGMYFETIYYPNMGFISRHEVSEELEMFLSNILK